jgi:hypothetical protein
MGGVAAAWGAGPAATPSSIAANGFRPAVGSVFLRMGAAGIAGAVASALLGLAGWARAVSVTGVGLGERAVPVLAVAVAETIRAGALAEGPGGSAWAKASDQPAGSAAGPMLEFPPAACGGAFSGVGASGIIPSPPWR